MGGTEQLARLAGAIVGLGLAFAAAAPFTGVPPQGVSGAPAPAQIEVRVLASGELALDPLGVVLAATPFPAPGERGGPSLAVTARNLSPLPLKLSVRLAGISPSLDEAVTVRASGAGAVLTDGSLKLAGEWSEPAGELASGASTTIRMRFKLVKGLAPDAYIGRLDIRQLELRTVPAAGASATTPSAPSAASPTPNGTAPAETIPPTSPAGTTPEPSR